MENTIPIIESKVKEFKERFTLPDELGRPALYRISPTEFGDEDMTESEDTKIARKMLQSLRQALLDVAQQIRLDTLEEVEGVVEELEVQSKISKEPEGEHGGYRLMLAYRIGLKDVLLGVESIKKQI